MSDHTTKPTEALRSVSSMTDDFSHSGPYQPKPGDLIDHRYELIQKIGEGGMGYVYAAKQLNIGRQVVIKLLKSEFCVNEEQITRFKREAELASKLSHPNCVTIHDFGFHMRTPYIAMEHLEGKPLSEVLYFKKEPLSLREIVKVISQVCDALEIARQFEVVHRDLKPENIFVLKEPQGGINIKVLDFGIAKLAHTHPEASNSNLTRGDMVFGTPQYMAPEQIRGKPLDHRADVYALTAIFYEMICGKLPYDTEDPADIISVLTQHLRDPIPQVKAADVHQHTVPLLSEVNHIITRGMAKQPEERIKTTSELKLITTALIEQSTQIAETKGDGGLSVNDETSDRLVTRPSLFFSTLGDVTHDDEVSNKINASDLLPSSIEDPKLGIEPSLSPKPQYPPSQLNQTKEMPLTKGQPLRETDRSPLSNAQSKRKPNVLIRGLFKVSIVFLVLLFSLSIAMHDSRSPLSKGQWRLYAPEVSIDTLNDIERMSHSILAPLYLEYLDMELPNLKTTDQDHTKYKDKDESTNEGTNHQHPLESVKVIEEPGPTLVEQKAEPPKLGKKIGVVSFTATTDCKLSVNDQLKREYSTAKSPMMLPMAFGTYVLKCQNIHGDQCVTQVEIEKQSKYPILCHLTSP